MAISRDFTQAVKSTNKLTLHADQLDSIVCSVDDTSVPFDLDAQRQFIVFTLSSAMTIGTKYKLSCSYTGKIHDDDKGFYRSSYSDVDGEKYVLNIYCGVDKHYHF